MTKTLDDKDWEVLLSRIKQGKCTPFLGAGACYGHIPLGGEIAKSLASEYNYPLHDCENLSRVTQYLAVEYGDPVFPKDKIIERWFSKLTSPDFSKPEEPHGLLSELPLPIYITTNYDDFLFQALKAQKKDPIRLACKWNRLIQDTPDQNGIHPSVANPVVFHLHGHTQMSESLIMTEDDYLDFVVNFSRDEELLPLYIRSALAGTTLLFIGYAINDINFRILFRSLVNYLEKSLTRLHMSVQLLPLDPNANDDQKHKAEAYLSRYFGELNIHIFWGTAVEFTQELRKRWSAFNV